MTKDFRRITPLDHPEYEQLHSTVSSVVWPEFMLHDAVANAHWNGLYENFPAYQFSILEPDKEIVRGIANSVPLAWNGPLEELPAEGWDWALGQSRLDFMAGRPTHTLCGIQIAVAPAYQGQGMSSFLLGEMRSLALSKGMENLIVPVRPSLKSQYPLTPMESYVQWKNDQGLPYDPWLRVHVRNGGRIVKVCPLAMRIEGTIADWETWTGMKFPETNDYFIPGALQPVSMNLESDLGVYLEPNVWIDHPLD